MSFLDPDDAPILDPVIGSDGRLSGPWEQWFQRSRRTYWDDLRFPAEGINPASGGANAPTLVTTDPWAGTLTFSASATNIICGVAQMPHGWKLRTNVHPHIHWCPMNTNTGNVAWRFSYQVAMIGGTFPAALTTAGIEVDAADGTTNKHQYHEFTAINMSAYNTVSTMIVWKLERVGGDASDTYNTTARFLELDFHYEKDLAGSRQEGVK